MDHTGDRAAVYLVELQQLLDALDNLRDSVEALNTTLASVDIRIGGLCAQLPASLSGGALKVKLL